MADFVIGTAANVAAANVAGAIIDLVIQKLKDIIEMGENVRHLKTDLTDMKDRLVYIQNQFRQQQRALPVPVHNCLERMHNDLQEVKDLIVRSEPQPRCLGCCSLRNPKLSTQIRVWKTRFDGLFQDLERELSVCANTQQIVSGAAHQAEVLLQPIPHSGFVGSTILSAQNQVQAWLREVNPKARMVGIYGMGGVGKTSLLKLVYNHFQEVRGIFEVFIWHTISQNYQIENLQASIAEKLNLDLKGVSDINTRKTKLYASLGEKKFLLILDDLWHSIDLDEVGVKFGDHGCSKVLMSSRNREVIFAMEASEDYTKRIQPLSVDEEVWELFSTRAFTNGVVPRENNREGIAREMASECKGLPLALNTVAAAMRGKKTEDEWRCALKLMRKVDPSFWKSNSGIEADLYKPLKWSYDQLADGLKTCFLYCAAFPEDAEINVETLVQMWSAEKLVSDVDAGQMYIDALVGRCLFEYVRDDRKEVKVHDIVHDLAIYIGRTEAQWLFATGQHRQDFPNEDEIGNCKRISVGHNDIRDLPTGLVCPKLVSLVLANNEEIREVKEGFFSAAMSLKVLDLSHCISITTLPTSLGQLEQLEFLNLSGCSGLENLPEETGNLSKLRFLHLEGCESLKSLPDSIGNLRNLKHLNLDRCNSLMAIPQSISHLTSLNKLFLQCSKKCAVSVEDIANLSNLMDLTAAVKVKSEIKESTMTKWTDLKRLEIYCVYDADRDDVVEDHIYPVYMDNLKKLEHFRLGDYAGVSLPICISQFQNLRVLHLQMCPKLRELPACQIGNATVVGGFPMLKRLSLHGLGKLESMMVGSSVLSSEETMPYLEDIDISMCRSLNRLKTKKLSSLKNLEIQRCLNFEALEIESGGLPVFQELWLRDLDKFETLVGPSGVINDAVMPKLQSLVIMDCPWLRRLSLDKLPMLKTLSLYDVDNLESMMVGSSVLSSEETMPQLEDIDISGCSSLKRLTTKKLSSLKNLKILFCREFEALEIESGGLPVLQELRLEGLYKFETLVINDGVMPKLQRLHVWQCGSLRRLSLDKLPYLRSITICHCSEIRELDCGFPMLERLSLFLCEKLENIVGPHYVSADETMPKLQSLKIEYCDLLRRLPRGMDKLLRNG